MWQKVRKIYPLQLEIVPLVLMFLAIYLTLINYPDLPDSIPSHFNFRGLPDRWASKSELIVYPAASIFVYMLISSISVAMAVVKDPKRLINLPARMKDSLSVAQAERLRIILVRCLLTLKMAVIGMMTYLLYGNLEVALGRAEGLGYWPFVFVLVILIVVGFMLYQSFRIAFSDR